MIKKPLGISLLCCVAALASAEEVDLGAINQHLRDSSIDELKPLPISGMVAVEKNGQVYFVSNNGRFVFKYAELYDTFTKKEVKTIADVVALNTRVDLAQMKLKIADITDIKVGTGKKELTLFTDPLCSPCQRVMSQLTPEVLSEYTVSIVLYPIASKDAALLSKNLSCLDSETAFNALRTHQYNQPNVKDCKPEKIYRAALAGQLLNITGVPYLIRADGVFYQGVPSDLQQWANQEI